MEWFLGIIISVVALAVLGGIFFGVKSRDDRPVPRHFNFDGYKERELSQRGLFDKTKWR